MAMAAAPALVSTSEAYHCTSIYCTLHFNFIVMAALRFGHELIAHSLAVLLAPAVHRKSCLVCPSRMALLQYAPPASEGVTLSTWRHALPPLFFSCAWPTFVMALNVPLLPSPDAPGGRIPSPFTGEVYILSRTALEMGYTDDSRRRANPSKGVLFLTTQRLVFLPEDATKAGYESLELPLRGMTREVLHQPIFACNNLTASCAYYENMPFSGELNFKIVFKNGGIGTFLPNFNRCLGAARQAASAAAAAGDHAGVVPERNTLEAWANEWGADILEDAVAAMDPSDPSLLYLTQPVVQSAGTEGRGSMPQLAGGGHASAGGLRHRG